MPATPPAPAQVTFRHLTPSPAINDRIQAEYARLCRHCDDLISCSVTVETPAKHHLHGRRFRISIELIRPGGALVVDHEPPALRAILDEEGAGPSKHTEVDGAHRDAYVAIRDAFDIARRRLEDAVRRRRSRQRV